jgi:hypothetical protein
MTSVPGALFLLFQQIQLQTAVDTACPGGREGTLMIIKQAHFNTLPCKTCKENYYHSSENCVKNME